MKSLIVAIVLLSGAFAHADTAALQKTCKKLLFSELLDHPALKVQDVAVTAVGYKYAIISYQLSSSGEEQIFEAVVDAKDCKTIESKFVRSSEM